MVRSSVVSGMFYEGDSSRLKVQIEKCFNSKFGPGLPKKSNNSQILGAVSPHAGFTYSGPCAAHTYHAIYNGKKPRSFIILSPNHTGFGRTSLTKENYETPLGIVKIDLELADSLLDNCHSLIDDMGSHIHEHSLEVQLPFLQYLYKEDFMIVPIVISSPHQCKELAIGISNTLEKFEDVCIIASSDFTHYGPNYEYTPFKENIKENVKKLDMGAIDKILAKDFNGLMEYVDENNATICGYLPIAVMIKALEKRIKETKLLKYYLSSDIIPDKENSVSYASIVFR